MKRVISIIFIALMLSSFVLAQTEEKNKISKEIEIPNSLSIPARVIFGISEEVPVTTFIILIAIWIILFLFIQNILEITPFFKGKISWVASAVITIIIAITGAIKSVAEFLLFTRTFLNPTENDFIFVAILLIILVVIFIILNTLLKPLKDYYEKESAKIAGEQIGKEIGMMKALRKTFGMYKGY